LPDSLVVQDISKRYGTGRPVIAGFSHQFEPGSITALVGPNGSGKTTLSRLLCVLSFPTSGRILYGDVDIHLHPSRYLRHVGVVDDAAELPHYLSAVELLEWIARERGTFDTLKPDGLSELLEAVLLDERRDELIGTYSSGMIRKTQLAAALAARPAVMILDEPFRGLDAESFAAALGIIRQFAASGGIVVMSTHRREVIDTLSDTIIEMPAATVRAPLAS
jgi:ABC-type multidrug transport system ATPase subunit